MKFSISSGELVKGLSAVIGAVPTKATLPILECVLFEKVGDQLKLSATDLELAIVESISANFEEDGQVAIPARKLLEMLRQLPDVPVVFEIDERYNVRFKTDRGSYKLVGESSADFPEIPSLSSGLELKVETSTLKETARKTSFAVSTDELRPAMMGVFFQVFTDHAKIVATDGHRLVKLVRTDIKAEQEFKFIIPERALNQVGKALSGDECTIVLSEDHVSFTTSKTVVVARLIREQYPNYEAVIPKENEKKLLISKDQMLAAVRRVSIFSSSSSKQIRLTLEQDQLTIQAEDIDFSSEAKETISCEYGSEPMMIGFNAKYLADILSNIEGNDALFQFSSPNRAGIVKPAEQAVDEELLMLVMPVMLNSYNA